MKNMKNEDMTLSYEQTTNGGVLLRWHQTGPFSNYTISRYTVRIYSKETGELFEELSVLTQISQCKTRLLLF